MLYFNSYKTKSIYLFILFYFFNILTGDWLRNKKPLDKSLWSREFQLPLFMEFNFQPFMEWYLLNIIAQWMLNHWLSDPGWHGLLFRVAFVDVQAGSWGGVEDHWRLSSSKRVNVVNELDGRTKPSMILYPTERIRLSIYKSNEELQSMPAWSTKSVV